MDFKFFGSKIIIVFTLAGIGLLVFAIGKETYRKHLVEREINKLEEQVQELEKEKTDLNETLAYLDTEASKEIEARKRLNLVKPGERVAVLKDIDEEKQEDLKTQQDDIYNSDTKDSANVHQDGNQDNWRLWWQLFFE